jgi:hypothetical protein
MTLEAAGFDRVERRLTNLYIDGEYLETLLGTPSADSVQLHTENVVIGPHGRYDSQVRLLQGDDRLEHVMGGLLVAGSYSEVIDGGAGSDWLRMAQTHAGGAVVIPSGGRLRSERRGGDGNDLVSSQLSYEVSGNLSVQLFGGGDHERLISRDTLTTPADRGQPDPAELPAIRYVLDGGTGDDVLALRLDLAGALEEVFAALLDGGEGYDTCQVTPELPTVRVLNCEHNG